MANALVGVLLPEVHNTSIREGITMHSRLSGEPVLADMSGTLAAIVIASE